MLGIAGGEGRASWLRLRGNSSRSSDVVVDQPLSTALTLRIWSCTPSGKMNWAQKNNIKRTQTQSTIGEDARTKISLCSV